MTDPMQARVVLARDLKYLREAAGLSERQLAARLGVSQASIQRLENAIGKTSRSLPSRLIEEWTDATGADERTRDRVRLLVEAVLRKDRSWREKLGDKTHLQDEFRDLEATSHTIRGFQLTIVPGLLQTPEYARYIIPRADVDNVIDHAASVAARLARQEVLFSGGRRFEFLISETALHWPRSSPELLATQLDRIVALMPLKSVNVRILPLGEYADVIVWHNFVIYESDEPAVEVELTHRYERVTDPQQIELYRRIYGQLWEGAIYGAEAVTLIQRIANESRDSPTPHHQ